MASDYLNRYILLDFISSQTANCHLMIILAFIIVMCPQTAKTEANFKVNFQVKKLSSRISALRKNEYANLQKKELISVFKKQKQQQLFQGKQSVHIKVLWNHCRPANSSKRGRSYSTIEQEKSQNWCTKAVKTQRGEFRSKKVLKRTFFDNNAPRSKSIVNHKELTIESFKGRSKQLRESLMSSQMSKANKNLWKISQRIHDFEYYLDSSLAQSNSVSHELSIAKKLTHYTEKGKRMLSVQEELSPWQSSEKFQSNLWQFSDNYQQPVWPFNKG